MTGDTSISRQTAEALLASLAAAHAGREGGAYTVQAGGMKVLLTFHAKAGPRFEVLGGPMVLKGWLDSGGCTADGRTLALNWISDDGKYSGSMEIDITPGSQ